MERKEAQIATRQYTKVLTIAGSDSGGGAGIQADLKTFAACGCFGMSAITAITAQNSLGVRGIHGIPPEMIRQQIEAVLEDLGADAVKIGMLHSPEVIEVVHDALARFGILQVVLDPVMVATSGDRLLKDEAIGALITKLLPSARLITPNIPEAEVLLNQKIGVQEEMPEAAKALSAQISTHHRGVSVLLKAGHFLNDRLVDVLWDAESEQLTEFPVQRIDSANTHGTGCTLSSAIAAFLAKGFPLSDAVSRAKVYLHNALTAGAAYQIGAGHGPVHHFHGFWK